MIRHVLAAFSLAALASSTSAHAATCVPTPQDAERLRRLPAAWRAARADVVGQRLEADFGKLGVLVTPQVALDRPQLSPGPYRCRTVKIGAAQPELSALIAYPFFRCRVELTPGGDLILRRVNGSQRPVGAICPIDGPAGRTAAHFVGVLRLGSERRTPPYGSEADRDLVGLVQRIGPDRWRIAFPWPAYESKLDLLDLQREPLPPP